MKFGPLPMYEFAPMNTAPRLIATRVAWDTPTTSAGCPSPWARARKVRYVGALSRKDESAPVAQKNCHGSRTPSSAPRARRMSRAGSIVTKMPAKRAATSRIGWNVKRLARRRSGSVRTQDTTQSPTIASSRQGAPRKATAPRTPPSSARFSLPATRRRRTS